MKVEDFIVGGAYVRVPHAADLSTRQALRAGAAARGLPCLIEPTPDPAVVARAERMAQRGIIEPTVAKHDQRAFLAQLERIAAGKVVVG